MKLFFLSLPPILIISIFFSGCSGGEEENNAQEGYIPYPRESSPSLSANEQKKIDLEYNMELIELKNFSEIFGEIGKKDYGEARKMSEELKEYSFLNNAFVFEKK